MATFHWSVVLRAGDPEEASAWIHSATPTDLDWKAQNDVFEGMAGFLPDCLDSCGLDSLIAGNEGQAEVQRRGGNDAVWHFGNDIPGHSVDCLSNFLIDRRDT